MTEVKIKCANGRWERAAAATAAAHKKLQFRFATCLFAYFDRQEALFAWQKNYLYGC